MFVLSLARVCVRPSVWAVLPPKPSVSASVQLSFHRCVCTSALPSQYIRHYFNGLLLYPSCHTSAWRHRGWAGTPGSVAPGQLDLLPAWADSMFPQSGQRGTAGPEKSMRWRYFSWGLADKARPPSQQTDKETTKALDKSNQGSKSCIPSLKAKELL